MLNRSLKPLQERLEKAQKMMETVQSEEEFLALGNYIGNLYVSLACLGEDIVVKPVLCFGTKTKYKKFLKDFNAYSDDMMHHFVLKKDFHSSYIEEILPTVEKEWKEICPIQLTPTESLNKKEFKEILLAFLDSIKMVDLYRELCKEKRIHSSLFPMEEDYLGFTLFNPLSKDIDIVVGSFEYSLEHMNTLVHELGHGYDLKHFEGDAKDYNKYFYLSYYGEVISRLMERLLHRFLLNNHLIINSAKNSFIDFEDLNHDFLLQGYILSLLDSDFICSQGFTKCKSEVITKMIKKHFIEESKLIEYFEDIQKSFDVSDIFTYLYGDILSLFLCGEIEKSGFNNELMEEFMRQRTEPFQEEMLQKNGFNPKGYQKLYKKEIELIKK
ncbi:MAG: hypothetical protein IKF71_04925 [Bacilli bacterium]|nr:hypothetical protein [Bacilli bacterium]